MDVVWPKLILHSRVYGGLDNSRTKVRKGCKHSELSFHVKPIKVRLRELVCTQTYLRCRFQGSAL